MVGHLWTASGSIPMASEHPARRWLAARHLWRAEIPAPEVLRWTSGGRWPRHEGAGAIIAPLAPVDAWLEAWPRAPAPRAVQLIHVDAAGAPALDRPAADGGLSKRTHGTAAGLVIIIGCPIYHAPYPSGPVHVLEGLADGLGRAARFDAPAVVTAGTAGQRNPPPSLAEYLAAWPGGCRMVADDDARTGAVGERNEGLRAARTLARAVEAAGGTAVVVHADTGKDYADTAAAQGFPPLDDGWQTFGADLRAMYPHLPRWEIGRLAAIAGQD